LIFAGKELKDSKTLNEESIEDYSTIHVVLRIAGGMNQERRGRDMNRRGRGPHRNSADRPDVEGRQRRERIERENIAKMNRQTAKEELIKAKAFFARKMYRRSEQSYTRAIELDPRLQAMEVIYCRRAQARMKYGDFISAQADINRAIQLNKNYGLAHNLLGRFYIRQGQHDEGVTSHERAVNLEPQNINFNSDLRTARVISPFVARARGLINQRPQLLEQGLQECIRRARDLDRQQQE